MKPLLIGELNPYGSDQRYALYPEPPQASGGRLMRILGLDVRQYLRAFGRVNLCTGKWDPKWAEKRAATIALANPRPMPFVLLGAKVSKAFGLDFKPFERVTESIYVLPHPSGLCRIWNEPGAIKRARDLILPLIKEST